MFQKIVDKEALIAVIGLGYVGLPIALELAKKAKVIGFDIVDERITMLNERKDPSEELDADAFEGCDIEFTSDIEELRKANFFIIAVSKLISSPRPKLSTIAALFKSC